MNSVQEDPTLPDWEGSRGQLGAYIAEEVQKTLDSYHS